MNAEQIGALIRRRRKSLGVDQNRLAELAGISTHTLSNIETGNGNPTLGSLNKVLEVLGLELSVQTKGGSG